MTALAILVALGPLTGPAAALAGARARLAGAAQAAGAAIALGCSLALLVMLDGRAPLFGWDGFLYVDSLGGFFLMTVAGGDAARGARLDRLHRGAGRQRRAQPASRSGCTSRSSACSPR